MPALAHPRSSALARARRHSELPRGPRRLVTADARGRLAVEVLLLRAGERVPSLLMHGEVPCTQPPSKHRFQLKASRAHCRRLPISPCNDLHSLRTYYCLSACR
eukprot:3006537-Pleurochrysis_carterae.AAC.1